ncbi:hypothetical protein N7534_011675 [Penicillium rubens]|nr:hypothetical protein N7524_006717 [Penicillium chrysogenum]KAJ5841845.1 hypothetical protein N7534_011675 [Penicillium rubens]
MGIGLTDDFVIADEFVIIVDHKGGIIPLVNIGLPVRFPTIVAAFGALVALEERGLHTLATRGRNWGFREEALETV